MKIRGHRIELGEIEESLRQHRDVKDVVVVAREDVAGDKRLVAYCVLTPAAGLSAATDSAELRRHLQARLPEFMVPAQVVLLPALPLTPNGKVDRKALPAPEAWRGADTTPVVQLDNGLETLIATVWQQVLGVPRIGADDNFFDLGGHSLLVVQVLAQLREATGRDLPLTAMFRVPTVRALASYLQRGDHSNAQALDTSEERGSARRQMLQRRRSGHA